MAHHGSTPASVLNAPPLTPDVVWSPLSVRPAKRRGTVHTDRIVYGPFRGSVTALTDDPRAAQLAGRRKARAAANRAAKAASS